jgi:hypothetical protein
MIVRLLSRTPPMPYKQTEPRRHKFKKMKYTVTNWAEYNEALRQHGDISVWMSEEAVNNWHETKEAILVGVDQRRIPILPFRSVCCFVSSIASHCGKLRGLCAH